MGPRCRELGRSILQESPASGPHSSLPLGTFEPDSGLFGTRVGRIDSTAQSVTINPQTVTATALAASPNPSTVGQAVTLTATVTPAPTGTPAGTVSFFSGSTLLGTTEG